MSRKSVAPPQGLQEFAHTAVEKAKETTDAAMDSIRSGYDQTEEFVRDRPMETMAVAFSAGFIMGGLIACAIHSS